LPRSRTGSRPGGKKAAADISGERPGEVNVSRTGSASFSSTGICWFGTT
jgi:hypothetical protein